MKARLPNAHSDMARARGGQGPSKRVGILGGSFGPIHKGHLQLATAALRQLHLSRVYFVLARRSPLKKTLSPIPFGDRLKMMRLATRHEKRFRVADWELKRPAPSYTVTTLRAYKRKHPAHQLTFILGSDLLSDFHRWKKPREIAQLATLAVGLRPGAKQVRISSKFRPTVVILRGRFPHLSSSEIRKKMLAGKSIGRLVPRPVAAYLRREGLA